MDGRPHDAVIRKHGHVGMLRRARASGIVAAGLVLAMAFSLGAPGAAGAQAPEHSRAGGHGPPGHSNAGGNAPPAHSQAPGAGPVVETRVKDVIKVQGREFRDLNDNGRLDPYEDWRLSSEERAKDLVDRMTLEEKAGLMLISTFNDQGSRDRMEDSHLRHFIVRDNPTASDLAERNNEFQELGEASRLGIPVVFTSNPRNHIGDGALGHAEAFGQYSLWPGELGMAATQDAEMVHEFAQIAAKEWRASGMHKGYMYMADIAADPRWTRIDGTFGEDPTLAADMMTAIVSGFQGEELGTHSVSLTTKHFPGGGARLDGRDPHHAWGKDQAFPTPGSLFEYHLPPFEAAVDAGTTSIMPYYAAPKNDLIAEQLPKHLWYSDEQQFEEVGFAFNERMLQGLLRDELGFTGYVNSDTGVIASRAWGVEDLTQPERYAKAVEAGTNLFSGGTDVAPLIEALEGGLIDESDLRPSLIFTLTEMFDLGLFDNPYLDPDHAQAVADDPESQARADEAHRRSVTLLRNDEGVLPLTDDEIGTARLYAEAFGRGDDSELTADLHEGLEAADPELTLVDDLDEATHAVAYVTPSVSWRDDQEDQLLSIDLADLVDVERIKEIQAAAPTVLVVNQSNPWLLNHVEPDAAAVVATFNVTTDALVDVLRGRFDPEGRLPVTVPADEQAVLDNRSDVPGYAEGPEYPYTDRAGNAYVYGFGLGYESTE